MKNTKAVGWGMLLALSGAPLLGGCDLVAGIGEFCEIGVDCGTGGAGGAGGGGGGAGGTASPGGGGAGGAPECSGAGTKQPCYTGPDGTKDVGLCAAGEQACQANGTWGPCLGEALPKVETCAAMDDEDCDGNECAIWSRIFGDGASQLPLSVAIDAGGNTIVLGRLMGKLDLGGTVLESAGGNDLFVAKFDPAGKLAWGSRYGDAKNQVFASLALDSAGNVLVAGTFEGALDFGGKVLTAADGGADVFVAKLTLNGGLAWANRYGDAANQSAWDLAVDSNDDVLVLGELAGSMQLKDVITAVNGTDVWVARFDGSNGNVLSQLQFDDKAGQSGTLSVAAGPAGVWAITGLHGNGAVIGGDALPGFGVFAAKFGPGDAPLWSVHLPMSSVSEAAIDSAGNVIVGGDFFDTMDLGGTLLTSNGIADIVIAKLGAIDGAAEWAVAFGGDGNDQGLRFAVDMNDNIFFALGTDSSMIDFGGGTFSGKGLNDLYVVALGPDGAHRWSRAFGDAANQSAPRIGIDSAGAALVVAADVSGTINFGAGDLDSSGNDIALARLAP